MVNNQTSEQPDPTSPDDQLTIDRHPAGATRATIHVRQLSDRETPAIAARLKSEIAELTGTDRNFVIHVEHVQFMNSMGLGMLINMRNRLHERGCQTILIGVSDHLRSLLDLVRASRLFRIANDDDHLRTILKGGPDPD